MQCSLVGPVFLDNRLLIPGRDLAAVAVALLRIYFPAALTTALDNGSAQGDLLWSGRHILQG
jgi:hypothetical protein